jgi:IMP dehydrogenase
MAEFIGEGRRARRCYGFDDVALVPGRRTLDEKDTDTTFEIAGRKFSIPVMASAMDGVVDVKFAVAMSKLGGFATLNLDGVQTRYENPGEILAEIANADPKRATELIQKAYTEPVKIALIAKRVAEIKALGGFASVSCVPANAAQFAPIAEDAGADMFVVQGTVVSAHHVASTYQPLDLYKFNKERKVPVILGNCVTFDVAVDLMETGCAGLLVGVGPGAACTTRGVTGIGVPQITATADAAAARDFFHKKTGKYVPIITDGGMRIGGEICKAIAAGADAVMIGSPFARAAEAPGRGYHWGMATSHSALPRGTRVYVGTSGSLEQILKGPATADDGSQNLVGALRNAMGLLGARNIREMQMVEIVIAPSLQTEGKLLQKTQGIGMGTK